MLVLSRKKNESIMVGDDIEITVVEMEGDRVKLGIKAPKEVEIHRREVYDKIHQENVEASKISKDVLSGLPQVLRNQD